MSDLDLEFRLGTRQGLLVHFMHACRVLEAAPMDALTAALYAAAQSAQMGMGMSEESFLDAAKEIFRDVAKQVAGHLTV